MSDTNTALWNSACKTDLNFTKQFSRAGGFSGTAISPMYLVRRATETFGPIGIGWGFEELESKIAEGVWFSRVLLWFRYGGETGKFEQWGATTLVNKRKDGSTFIDEEAAKKSVTDAVTKCLSYLGFGADVHMGMFEDNKYLTELKREAQREPKTATAKEEGSREAQAAVKDRKVADAERTLAELKAKAIEDARREISSAAAPVNQSLGRAVMPDTQKDTKPKSDYQKMIDSIQALKAEFEELGAVDRYYFRLGQRGFEKSNQIRKIDEGREVYRDLQAELKVVRASTPIEGQDESPLVVA